MAHLWTEAAGRWAVTPLDDEIVVFTGRHWMAAVPVAAGVAPGTAPAPIVARLDHSAIDVALVRAMGEGAASWALVIAPAAHRRVRVNGAPLRLGLRVLADRDEVSVDEAIFYFSTETLPSIAPFEGALPVSCPRCKSPIQVGDASVQCPGCRTRYHQSDDRPCWLYAPACGLCGRATALDQPYSWTPEES